MNIKLSMLSLTSIFSNALIDSAAKDQTVVGIRAAMPVRMGMDIFGIRFSKRTYGVSLAEQHAVTTAYGMACKGLRPLC